MESNEDFEFVVQTSEGSRDVVVSKTALRALSGAGVTPMDATRRYRDELKRIVERKIATGRAGAGQIRLHGTDFSGAHQPRT
jgi:hypothetical protein